MKNWPVTETSAPHSAYVVRAGAWSAGFAAVFFGLYAASVLAPFGQLIDAASLGLFSWIDPQTRAIVTAWRNLSPTLLAVAGLSALAAGLIRRRFVDTLYCVAGVAATLYLSTVLKSDLLGRPYFGDFGYTSNTYPSGHVAVSLMTAVAIVRLLPLRRSLRPIILALTVIVALVAVASVVVIAHRVSDVVGGTALAGFFVPFVVRARVPNAGSLLPSRGRQRYALLISLVASVLAALSSVPIVTPIGMIVFLMAGTAAGAWLVLRLASDDLSPAPGPLRPDKRKLEV